MRPKELDLYKEAVAEEAKWKKRKEELRPIVLAALKAGDYPDIYWSKPKSKPSFDPKKLYEFVKDKVPAEVIESLTYTVIDEKALDELFVCGYFAIEDIPEECYSEGKEQERINIPKVK